MPINCFSGENLDFFAVVWYNGGMETADSRNNFQIPSFARAEVYNFEAMKDNFEIYQELSQVAEEIEKCRRENS